MQPASALIAIVALLGAASSHGQEAPRVLTLPEALGRAVEANRTAERARTQAEIAQQQSRFLYANLFPHVSISGNYTRNAESVHFELGGQRINLLPENDWAFRATVRQPIYAGGREIRAYRQSRLLFASAEEGVRSAEETALLRTATSYLGAVQGAALVEVEKSNIALSEKRRVQAQNFYDAGEVTRVDVLRAETAVKAAQRRMAGATQAERSALSALRLELALDSDIAIENRTLALPPIPSEEELMARAEAARPELRQAENLVHAARLQVNNERAAYLPVVTAEGVYTQQKANFPTEEFGSLTLNFSVPVWDNGQIRSRIAQARQQEREAELILAEARQGVREQVRLALLDLETARTHLELAREQLVASEAEYQQITDLYAAQEATSLDVDAAEAALAEARRGVVTSTIDESLAQLRVWHAAGSLKNILSAEVQQ